MTADAEDAPPFRVLLVCTANQCRSPIAEHLLRRALEPLSIRWSVTSAGTHARAGGPMDASAAQLLTGRGFEVGSWRSTQLTNTMIDRADLILTAEAAHRARVVSLRPNSLPRTFPLLQFGRLAALVEPIEDPAGPAAGDLLVERVRVQRAHVQPVAPGEDDIRDPVGRRMRAFRSCFDTIGGAVSGLVAPLTVAAELTTIGPDTPRLPPAGNLSDLPREQEASDAG